MKGLTPRILSRWWGGKCLLLGVRGVSAIGKVQESRQNQHRRNQHDSDSDVHDPGALHVLRRRSAETHHTLSIGRGRRQSQDWKQPFHWVRITIERMESGMKTSIIRMQKMSIGNSVRNRLKRSNLRCMK